jgi:F0F1-type ATP synthase assembly protein I
MNRTCTVAQFRQATRNANMRVLQLWFGELMKCVLTLLLLTSVCAEFKSLNINIYICNVGRVAQSV